MFAVAVQRIDPTDEGLLNAAAQRDQRSPGPLLERPARMELQFRRRARLIGNNTQHRFVTQAASPTAKRIIFQGKERA
jgi:hypothetical protein